MFKKILVILFIITLAGTAFWFFDQRSFTIPIEFPKELQNKIRTTKEAFSETIARIEERSKDIKAPPPLRALIQAQNAYLTREGVLEWTNIHRNSNGGLSALSINSQLNDAAELKLQEMFSEQYFEHISPAGEGPSDKVDRAGYAYIAVGENLALGNFEDDKVLLQGWMDSPGHRENILSNFTEIGIAVGEGTFEGKKTWLAVQMFGRPLSACKAVDTRLEDEIRMDEGTLEQLRTRADVLLADIEQPRKFKTQAKVDAYNSIVKEYNQLIAKINLLIKKLQGEITVYNGQVQAFNTCAQG